MILFPNCKSISDAAFAFTSCLWMSYSVIPSFVKDTPKPISFVPTVTVTSVSMGINSPLLKTETLSPVFNWDLSIFDLWLKSDVVPGTGVAAGISSLIRLAVL